MCGVMACIQDLTKLTPEELDCIAKWLQKREDDLQAQSRALQAIIDGTQDAKAVAQAHIEDAKARLQLVDAAFGRGITRGRR